MWAPDWVANVAYDGRHERARLGHAHTHTHMNASGVGEGLHGRAKTTFD